MGDKLETTPEPPAELYPGAAADLARKAERDARTAAANASVLPGALAAAFASEHATIGGLTVRPVVHYDFVILRQLGSPLLTQLGGAISAEARTPFDDEQGYEMVWQFTRPIREVIAALAQGRDHVREIALETIGLTLGPVEVALLVKAVENEFLRAFATVVKYGSPPAEGDGTVFTAPPAAARTTASAGGSTTSPG